MADKISGRNSGQSKDSTATQKIFSKRKSDGFNTDAFILCLNLIIATAIILILTGLVSALRNSALINKTNPLANWGIKTAKIDDWQYEAATDKEDGLTAYKNMASIGAGSQGGAIDWGLSYEAAPMVADNDLGFSTGGAKDVNNFRENIENDYLPLPTDITYEGLFYDYYFDTGKQEECAKLFCPSYSTAISLDPLSEEERYYLAVGLNSGLKESNFERKKLNLVIVLDISGSMGSSFNKYYYDRFGEQREVEGWQEEDANKNKMQVAAESVAALTKNLRGDDRLGVVLFDNTAYLAKPLNLVAETDMDKIREHILEIQARGGTNMPAGIKMGRELFDEIDRGDPSVYENRIIFLTDAMPNMGDVSEEGLLGQTSGNADNKIYTTFIGIGVDFNTELVEKITKIRGANYYSAHSSQEFKTRMDDEFEFMVTPLVFNLLLKVEAEDWEIQKVYGSPEADEATGEIMKVNTLFPSRTKEGETRGGLVLLELKKTGANPSLKLSTTYEDRNGAAGSDEKNIQFAAGAEEYDNNGIRKGIALSRYANMIKNWIIDERAHYEPNKPLPLPYEPRINYESGILCPPPPIEITPLLGQWERQSIDLRVSDKYKEMFGDFKSYMEEEIEAIGDPEMEQEIEILDKLIGY